MGRKKLPLELIENPVLRQIKFSKRKNGIVKKASELSILCDTDVGLVMFSSSGQLSTFASNGSVSDIFLRFFDEPDGPKGKPFPGAEGLRQSLRKLSNEEKMLEKMARLEASEEELNRINLAKHEAQKKLRSYNPNLEEINSVDEAQGHQYFLVDAIRHIVQLKASLRRNGWESSAERESRNSKRQRILSGDEPHDGGARETEIDGHASTSSIN